MLNIAKKKQEKKNASNKRKTDLVTVNDQQNFHSVN